MREEHRRQVLGEYPDYPCKAWTLLLAVTAAGCTKITVGVIGSFGNSCAYSGNGACGFSQ